MNLLPKKVKNDSYCLYWTDNLYRPTIKSYNITYKSSNCLALIYVIYVHLITK